MDHAEIIRIRGLVQGVGFRPTVWQLAQEFNIQGQVRNDGEGVQIIACSNVNNINRLLNKLSNQPPALARIDSIERKVVKGERQYVDFSIVNSHTNNINTGLIADAATCEHCQQEINNPNDRRFGYAFTNCTHCGPRLSIVKKIPYDRANTSMQHFKLCSSCQAEYINPGDRRFHAQPNACPDCGPTLQLCDHDGQVIATENVLQKTADLIKQGSIVAIKGIGGFQLACAANQVLVIKTLRQRKQRSHKAFALMASSISKIKQYCHVSTQEQATLESSAAPIVLLKIKASQHRLANNIAPGQQFLGFMLAYSPLHLLLMQQLDNPIVLTSGNTSNEPQATDNQQALRTLSTIADYWLMHDRDIVNRIDDSVVRLQDTQLHFYRRARGYAPAPLSLPPPLKSKLNILACGSELKNTFCLLRDDQATLSQHIGNLDNPESYDDYLHNLALYQKLYQFEPELIAVDKHPDYHASQYGRQLAEERQIPLIEIQHHHAHIASCLAENHWYEEKKQVIGVALDGMGFGLDGSIWGGEFLLANYLSFERKARLKPTPLPGGNQASLQPWRNTFAHLLSHSDWPEIQQKYAEISVIKRLTEKPISNIEKMINSQINSPPSSSCGRLFDAVAFALGRCLQLQSYEGQAAIELENLIDEADYVHARPYTFNIELNDNNLLEINPANMWRELLEDLKQGVSPSFISASFHQGLAHIVCRTIQKISSDSGITTVALSGGVFQNMTLLKTCQQLLQQQSLTVLTHQHLPANDGGLSLGQAAIASARMKQNLLREKSCV